MRNSRSATMIMVVLAVSIGWLVADAFSPRLLGAGTNPAGNAGERDILTYVEDLTRERRKDRENAAIAIRETHDRLIKRLIELAKQPSEAVVVPGQQEPDLRAWHEAKHLAILLLGHLRASQAVPVLLENIEYVNPREFAGSIEGEGDWHPAVGALAEIGMPAVEPTIWKLSKLDPKSTKAQLCCWILREVLGANLARARLHIAIDEMQYSTPKQNLKVALPYFGTRHEQSAEDRTKEREGNATQE